MIECTDMEPIRIINFEPKYKYKNLNQITQSGILVTYYL
jgi:hypothetical protein